MGKFALWEMNLSHTPSARWNLSLIDFCPDWVILDEGCGGGRNIKRMLRKCPDGEVYGIDYSEVSVEASRKENAQWVDRRCFIRQADSAQLPFEDVKFNLVTAFETVYFWPDLQKSFTESFRVLKPGGHFVFSYGIDSGIMRYWTKRVEGMRLVPLDTIKEILSFVGFKNIKVAMQYGFALNIQAER